MADIFQTGEEASQAKFVGQLEELRGFGQQVLNLLETARLSSLVDFDRRLSSINSRRQRAHRVQAPQRLCHFPVSDLLDIDQTQTTATVRIDSESMTLRERSQPVEATVRTSRFSASKGAVEVIDSASSLFRVTVLDGSSPTGQFDVELVQPLVLNLLVFDIIASPSEPDIQVQASSDGVTFLPAVHISRNGYRVNAWLPNLEVRFVRIQVTPSHPDNLRGTSFSFGVTSFSAITSLFHLRSELLSRTQSFSPHTLQMSFRAEANPEITYFLSLQGGPFVETKADQSISVPGTAAVTAANVSIDTNGKLAHTLPGNIYLSTLVVTEQALVDGLVGQVPLKTVPGLSPTDTRVPKLVNEYIGVIGTDLYLIRNDNAMDIGRTFNLSYITGPSLVTAKLKVRMSTTDRAVTPVFHGAALEEI